MNMIERFKTATGVWWLPVDAPNDSIINEMRAGRVYDVAVVQAVASRISSGCAVLDVGSNFGQMAVIFSRLAGTVHAFEADPFICKLLRRNLEENNCANVVVHEGAVWKEAGEVIYPEPDFKRFDSYGSYGVDPLATDGRKIRAFTIDSLHIQGPISVMKIDVQGADLFAMRGARETIEREKMPIIFEFERLFQEEFGTSMRQYIDFYEEIGYEETHIIDSVNHVIEPIR